MFAPPENLRQVSSRLTFIVKFISPVATLLVGGEKLFSIGWFGAKGDPAFITVFSAFLFAILAFHLWTAWRIKVVTADSNNLYVSNYFKETTIPLEQIADITEMIWFDPRVITIHLSSPSEFGLKIAFLAPYRVFAFYSPSPIIDELVRMQLSKSMR